jgi:MarR family 2-MHQ and catechol resistance regulon transcriptional repressor
MATKDLQGGMDKRGAGTKRLSDSQFLDLHSDKREAHYIDRVRAHSSRYKEFHRPSVELLLNLVYTYDVVRSRIAKRIEACGLSPATFNTLMILSHYGENGCPMYEIGELLLVSRPNVTGLIDSLACRGLVERIEKEGDRRFRLVRLTQAGKRLLDELLPSHYEDIRAMLAGMSDKEKLTLSKLLTKLRHEVLRSSERTPEGKDLSKTS